MAARRDTLLQRHRHRPHRPRRRGGARSARSPRSSTTSPSSTLDRTGLAIDHAPADLDAFGAPGTALRAAAEALRGEADDPALPDEERAAALTALSRLYAFAGEAA